MTEEERLSLHVQNLVSGLNQEALRKNEERALLVGGLLEWLPEPEAAQFWGVDRTNGIRREPIKRSRWYRFREWLAAKVAPR